MRKHFAPPYNAPFLPFPDDAAQICAASPLSAVLYTPIRLNLEDINSLADAYNPALQLRAVTDDPGGLGDFESDHPVAVVADDAGEQHSIPPYITPLLAFSPDAAQPSALPQDSVGVYMPNLHQEIRILGGEKAYMSAPPATNPAQIQAMPQVAAGCVHISPERLATLGDLLRRLSADPKIAMLRTTANHIVGALAMAVENIGIEMLVDIGPQLQTHLACHPQQNGKPYTKFSIKSYRNYARILVQKAMELGWTPPALCIPESWSAIVTELSPLNGCGGIIRYAARHGCAPQDFTLVELEGWADTKRLAGCSYEYIAQLKNRFRRAMRQCGFVQPLGIGYDFWGFYGIPLAQMPDGLRADIERLLNFKLARHAEGRPRGSRYRKISADGLVAILCRICGFWVNVRGHSAPAHLLDLVTHEIVNAFVSWQLNDLKRATRPLQSRLGQVHAALKQCPDFNQHDFGWFGSLVANLEEDEDEQSRLEQRKAAKWLPYDTLAAIPAMIRRERVNEAATIDLAAAQSLQDELLAQWLVTLPWRQRNIRECRLGLGGNLFKAKLPASVAIAKSKWVEDALRRNADEEFWQFRFRPPETKTGHDVWAVVPRQLVSTLEEYLQHRSALLHGSDSGTLFLNRKGGPLTAREVRYLVGNITLRYGGRRVNPHLFRDIFAYKWLEDHPDDYLTLSKILWHRSIKTTLQTYGRNFNESNGVRRVEEWLDRRA